MRWIYVLVVPALFALGCQETKDNPQPDPARVSPSSPPASGAKDDLTKLIAGTIKGKAFQPDQIKLSGQRLSFRAGKDFFPDMEIEFNLPARDGKSYEGKEWTFAGKNFANPMLTVKAKDGKRDFPSTEFVDSQSYSMTLKITKHSNKVVEGVIDLNVTNPANTVLAGKFSGKAEKDVTEPLDADDAPYVQGKIVMKGDWKSESLTAGFIGKGADGKSYSNSAGTTFEPKGSGWVSGGSFAPQITSVVNNKETGPGFKHTQMKPGEYLLYVKRGGVMAAWKKITVKAGDQHTVDLTIDLANVGSLEVTLPDEEVNKDVNWDVQLVPEGVDVSDNFVPFAFNAGEAKKGQKVVTMNQVPSGKYKVIRGDSEGVAEVVAGKKAAVTLIYKKKN